MDWSNFFAVFNSIAVLYAAATGVAFGASAILWISLRYPPKVPASTRLLAGLVMASAVSAGTLFFAGQIVQAIASDPNWLRALARGALWEIFSVSMGLGFGVAYSFAQRKPKPTQVGGPHV